MEVFVLIIWLMRGEIYEETSIPGLGAEECVTQLFNIQADRGVVRTVEVGRGRTRIVENGHCIGSKGTALPRTLVDPVRPCAHLSCGWDLPNRRRV